MAVAVVSQRMVRTRPSPLGEIELSTLTAGETETVSFPTGHPGAALKKLTLKQVKTSPTSLSPVFLQVWASDESNNQFTCKFDTEAGGDLTGGVVLLELEWDDQAAQDSTSISSDTD